MSINKFKNYFTAIALSAVFFSCGSDDSSRGDENSGADSKYVFSYWLADYTQYIWGFDSLDRFMTGEISMQGIGIEQKGDCIAVNNTLFACSTDDDGGASLYIDQTGKLVKGNKIAIESVYAFGTTEDNKAVLIGASWEGSSIDKEMMIYDPNTVSIIRRKMDNFAEVVGNETLYMWPTGLQTSGNKLYVTGYLLPRVGNNWGDKRTTETYIRVYDYPSLTYVKTIKDTRTTPAGIYYSNTGTIRTENGDIYTFSSNAYAGIYTPKTDAASGILRIKSGTDTFDADYFLNFEQSSVTGKVLSAYYAGGNKVVVKYIPKNIDTTENQSAFLQNTKPILKSAIVDLISKTVTPITGLPDHSGDEYFGLGSMYVENGKAYKSYLNNTESRIYQIDLSTGVAKPGALLKGGLHMPVITKLTKR
ncbi:DUF4374 domain-containing protein [Flavobacterium sp. '19STA2R22 D10 B1']|uniref:DUF4374 domain-containing protein n=1 Tax=Flavobacterium aerium TaxID=3037261 RepID=UPI00278C0418|nr:DUF4374 domain-containing protein [Flavobacterium sp. '19STA2R22 D10 B1']